MRLASMATVSSMDFGKRLSPFTRKESKMASNQKSGGSKQGSSSGSSSGSKQSDNQGSRSGGTQGGTHEQHVEAGRQSHKNDGKKSSSKGK